MVFFRRLVYQICLKIFSFPIFIYPKIRQLQCILVSLVFLSEPTHSEITAIVIQYFLLHDWKFLFESSLILYMQRFLDRIINSLYNRVSTVTE